MCFFLRLKERDLKYSALEERGIFQVIRAWNGLFNSSGLSYWLTGKCRHSLREWSLVADIVQFRISVYGLFCVRAFRTRHISRILYFILFTLLATFFASTLAEIKDINFKCGQASRQWKLSTTKCQSPYTESWVVDPYTESWVVDPMSELLLFVYNKSHVTLHVKSNAEKVNSPFWWHFATTERCKLFCGSRCDIWFHQLT